MHEFRELAKDVYAFLQPPLICYSSAGVIVGDRDVIVVDSLTNAAMTESLLTEIRRVTNKPIRFLINTHSHVDHVYTNHLFPDATVIGTHRGREETKANLQAQAKHDALFAKLFPDVDFRGGRYTLQNMSFSGSLSFYQGEREIRVFELGVGHSESDVVVHLPGEKIVFCGDLFMNGMPPVPGEGHVTQTIANYKAIEALEAEIYVAGHGDPGNPGRCARSADSTGKPVSARQGMFRAGHELRCGPAGLCRRCHSLGFPETDRSGQLLGIHRQATRNDRPRQSEPHDPAAGDRHRGQAAIGQKILNHRLRRLG